MFETKLYYVTTHTPAVVHQTGKLKVPSSYTTTREIAAYILEHIDEIDFGEPTWDVGGESEFDFDFGETPY